MNAEDDYSNILDNWNLLSPESKELAKLIGLDPTKKK